MEETETIMHSDDDCAPVAYLKCGKWVLEPKPPTICPSTAVVHVVSDSEAAAAMAAAPKRGTVCARLTAAANDNEAQPKRSMVLLQARTARDAAAGNVLEDAGIADEARLVLESIHRELLCQGLDWRHVAMMGVYLTDMTDFAVVNSVYSSFLPFR